jgi:death-on-curing protein
VALLESALARPRNVFHYEDQPALVRLAAVYAHGIVRNHPFIDGNKRTAFITSAVFLLSNGYHLRAPQAEVVTAMLQLASNAWDETALGAWLQGYVTRLK